MMKGRGDLEVSRSMSGSWSGTNRTGPHLALSHVVTGASLTQMAVHNPQLYTQAKLTQLFLLYRLFAWQILIFRK